MRFFFLAVLLVCLTSEAAAAKERRLLCRYTSGYDSSTNLNKELYGSEIISLHYNGEKLADFSFPFDCDAGTISKDIIEEKIIASCSEEDHVFNLSIFESFEMNRYSGEFTHYLEIISDEVVFMIWHGICAAAERRF